MTTEPRPLIPTHLRGVDEHIEAMLAAATPSESAGILASAQSKWLTGFLLTCSRHGGRDMTFAELHVHCAKHHHEPGDVRLAEPDPLEARKLGGDR